MNAVLQPQPEPVPALPNARVIRGIVIHCSATPSGRPLGQPGGPSAAFVIDGWHAQRGFRRTDAARAAFQPQLRALGYHAVIDVDGTAWPGRHPREMGAHARGFNAHTLAVCLVGGAERDAVYTLAQWNRLRALVRLWAADFGIPQRRPLNPRDIELHGGIVGHRDLSPDLNRDGTVQPHEWLKTCPGFDVGHWLDAGMQPNPRHVLGGAP